jgi:predicted permease
MWFHRRRLRARDELAFHRDTLIEDYVAGGMDRPAAERRAFLEFGNIVSLEEASRDVRGRWLEDFGRDLAYALRNLRRHPGFATIAVLSLALAIGANTAIFSLVNTVLLRPLPVHEPDRLVQVTRLTPEGRPASVSYALFEHLRDHVQSLSSAFAYAAARTPVAVDGGQEFVAADLVSGDYFTVLGVGPAAGRLLGPADDTPSTPAPAAVISDGYWQRRFGRHPSAIGRTLTIRDRVFTIVGVTPASFRSARVGARPDLILPLALMVTPAQRNEPTNNFLKLIARLKRDASVEQASAESQVLWQAFIEPIAATVPGGLRSEVLARRAGALPAPDGINDFRRELSQPLLILMGIVAFILLLTSVNLSGLLAARAAARQREILIRLAIGASRGRLFRQLLTESLALACLGAGIGLVLAVQLSAALTTLFINGRDLELSVVPDWRVLTFTATVALVVCLFAGLIPTIQAFRVHLSPALKEGRATGHGRVGKALVMAQVAISMMLIVGATLFIGTLVKLYRVERGFDGDGVLAIHIRSFGPVPADRALPLIAGLVERLETLPRVRSASAAQVLPLSGTDWTRGIELPSDAARPGASNTAFNVVAPAYFATLGTPFLSGRDFDARDTRGAPPVAIVNDSFARHFFGQASPLGRRVTSLNVTYDIVGVVRDALYDDVRKGFRQTLYVASTQRDESQPTSYKFLVRVAGGDPAGLAPAIARLVREADAALQLDNTQSYDTLIDQAIPAERILAALGGVFGVLAVVIAGIGMFSLLAFQVAGRTNELGVRMALGATRWSMVALVLNNLAWMLVPGIALGAGGALLLTGLAGGILYGLSPTDPTVYAIAASVLGLAATAAVWLPARRASRVDPLVALRHE